MIEPTIPIDEEARISALHALKILDTPPEERFDRLTRLASQIFDVPIAIMSLVDSERVWDKSCVGLAATESDRAVSFCGHAINAPTTFVVEDATLDDRFADNPLVTGEPFIKFYAGHPLTTPDGQRIGSFCIMDRQPRVFDGSKRKILEELAALVQEELGRHELNIAITQQRETEDRLRFLAESAPYFITAFGIDGRILYSNGQSRLLFGGGEEQTLVGRYLVEFLPGKIPDEVSEFLGQARAGMNIRQFEVPGKSLDGRSFLADVTFSVTGLNGDRIFIANGRDITESVAMKRELQRISEEQDQILSSTADGIIRIDAGRMITYANLAAHRMLRQSGGSFIGQDFYLMTHGGHAAADADADADADRTATMTDRYRRSDGTWFPVSFSRAPVAEEGEIIGEVVVFSDRTEQEAMERSKDEFLSIVSHELRTPLTSLKGSLGLVAGGVFGSFPEDVQGMLDLAVSNTDRLVRLVNDILDLQRVGVGRLHFDFGDHSIREVIAEAIHTVEIEFGAREVGLVDATDSIGSARVRCDRDRIIQVFTNLLTNAAKYSPAMSVVTVTANIDELDHEVVVIEFVDHGRGIPADQIDRIFERFGQVDSSNMRSTGGVGLGLAIAKALVEEHGGRLTVRSQPEEGSTFSVRLPIAGPGEVAS